MAKVEGRWAWWNQYGSLSFNLNAIVRRAEDARLGGVIIKWGYPQVERAFTAAGIPWATERYVLYRQPEAEATMLANAADAGGVAVVINAEEGGDEGTGGHWERDADGSAMRRLLAGIRARHPAIELYASVDTRANRLNSPYQKELAKEIIGWLPMIYPRAFQQTVSKAFAAALDGKDFKGIPVMPTIQTYGNIGAAGVQEELAEIKRRGLPGYQPYTICHATDAEWAIIVSDAQEDNMSEAEKAELYVLRVLKAIRQAEDAGRYQDAANALKHYLGVTAK